MPRKSSETNQSKNPILIKSRTEVSNTLQSRIKFGEDLLQAEIKSERDLDQFYTEKEKWDKYNLEYLKHSFDISTIADNYNYSGATTLYINPSFSQQIESAKRSLQLLINELKSIDERLLLFEEKFHSNLQMKESLIKTNKVFIVHGHDYEGLKHKVARVLNKLDLSEIILDEQASTGMTIIEKFEKYAQSACYAIILLTPDDMGFPKNFPDQIKPRARQNAIAELGYFMKALGRKNIAILSSDEIEIPSDFHGIVYLSVTNNAWEFRLAKEMKEAGLEIDLNKL